MKNNENPQINNCGNQTKRLSASLKFQLGTWKASARNLFLLLVITLMTFTACQKESTDDLLPDEDTVSETTEAAFSDDQLEDKEEGRPFGSLTSVNGQVVYNNSGYVAAGISRSLSVGKSYVDSKGGEIAILLQSFSGDADLYIYSNRGRQIKYSTKAGTSSELLSLKTSDFTGSETSATIYIYGWQASQYKIEIYQLNAANNGGSNANVPFSPTVLTNRNSNSVFAKSQNVFNDDQGDWSQSLDGQCTWYAYGRVTELVAAGRISQAMGNKLRNALCCTGGRHAKNWPSLVSGNWTKTNYSVLPYSKRKKGMLVVWRSSDNSSNPDPYGHIGFLEEVSSDSKRYRVTDFNRRGSENYDSKWYDFEGYDKISLSGGRTSDYPMFLPLD